MTVSTVAVELFKQNVSREVREFLVADEGDGGAAIRVAFRRETLVAGGGIVYKPGMGRGLTGSSAKTGLWAIAVAGDSEVYTDER
jgi:hypothetical protein